MVNVLIYLNSQTHPEELVELLLKSKLIAKATIDANNESFELYNGEIITKKYSIVTIQTKSLLFTQIVRLVEENYSANIPIYSLPITQSNHWFDEYVREQTLKI
jgi:uncharacterized protein involved in tolerance to divalent cations